MRPIDLSKTSIALSAYKAYSTSKKPVISALEKESVLGDAVKLTLSDEGKKLAEENAGKYSNLRIMRINNRNYH